MEPISVKPPWLEQISVRQIYERLHSTMPVSIEWTSAKPTSVEQTSRRRFCAKPASSEPNSLT